MANYSTGKENNNWRGGPGKGICLQCGNVFIAPIHKLKERLFCSRQCFGKSNVIPDRHITRPHVLIVEKILGKRLPTMAVVHHVNQKRKDHAHNNLVACQDQAYHLLLHARTRIVKAGGNPNTDKICSKCRQVKTKTEFHIAPAKGDGYRCYCKPCQAQIHQERKNHNGNSRT